MKKRKPRKLKLFDPHAVPHVLYDLMNFLTRPVREGPRTVVQCYIVRKRSGTLRLHPQPVSICRYFYVRAHACVCVAM